LSREQLREKKPKCKLRGEISFWTVKREGHIFVINYHNLTNKKFVKYFDYNWFEWAKKKLAKNLCQTWLEGKKENGGSNQDKKVTKCP
jgi:hypothetical protein